MAYKLDLNLASPLSYTWHRSKEGQFIVDGREVDRTLVGVYCYVLLLHLVR